MQRLMKQMQMLTLEPLCVPERMQNALADMAAGSDLGIPLLAPAKLTAMADQSLLRQLMLNLTKRDQVRKAARACGAVRAGHAGWHGDSRP